MLVLTTYDSFKVALVFGFDFFIPKCSGIGLLIGGGDTLTIHAVVELI